MRNVGNIFQPTMVLPLPFEKIAHFGFGGTMEKGNMAMEAAAIAVRLCIIRMEINGPRPQPVVGILLPKETTVVCGLPVGTCTDN